MLTNKATFAAGCFWGVEHKFAQIPGVISTRVGYCGGHTINPSYEQVCRDNTGHAEAVEIIFDPQKIRYLDLLDVFWGLHNPTWLNRQGPDIGSQYRSVIFYHNTEQQQLAMMTKGELTAATIYDRPIVTEIIAVTEFYPAEEYHQQYLSKHGTNYC